LWLGMVAVFHLKHQTRSIASESHWTDGQRSGE
jgi:hypothetical protein